MTLSDHCTHPSYPTYTINLISEVPDLRHKPEVPDLHSKLSTQGIQQIKCETIKEKFLKS